MVFYRKYRPQIIDELDSAAVRETLNSVLAKDPPHAFLFTGPKGLGKTSTARIIAKVVNCEAKSKVKSQKLVNDIESIEPCNECQQCKSITSGTNMDILEIDAASNRGIDEIRDLKEKIRLAPLSARKKVYIIDEVHMLTTEAFNALLKTLEEPPEHAMFILCTTEPQKVPLTILSRCFHIPFRPATNKELVRSFKRIAMGEGIAIDDDALDMIAQLAEGGFRDGTKIFEEIAMQLQSSGGIKITKELIEKKFQISNFKFQISNMLDSLMKKDTKSGLQVVGQLVVQGTDIKYFLAQLIEELHQMLLSQIGIKNHPLTGTGESRIKNIGFSMEEMMVMFDLFSKASAEMRYSVLPQLPLELAILEYNSLSSAEASGSKPARQGPPPPLATARQGGEESESLSIKSEKGEVTVSSLRKQVGTIHKIKALYGESAVQSDKTVIIQAKNDVDLMQVPANGEITQEWINSFWKCLISEMKTYNHTIAGVLRSCVIKNYDTKRLIIEAGYQFHKERLDDMKTREALMKVCKALTGKDVAIEIELKK